MEEIKENVYAVEEGAGQVQDALSNKENGSAALGKFKSVDALLQAYGALQSEFTRRSQRLKELERETENLKKAVSASEKESGVSGEAEKLRRRAEERKAEGKKFDEFVSDLEASRELEEKVESVSHECRPDLEEGKETTPPVAENRGDFQLSSDALYERVSQDENVRLKIIGEYLSSIGKTGAPLMKGGTGAFAAPPIKARSVSEAGSMALRFFKNDGTQA
jgi:hypothetical protein